MHEIGEAQPEAAVAGALHGLSHDAAMHRGLQAGGRILHTGEVHAGVAHHLVGIDAVGLQRLVDGDGDWPERGLLQWRRCFHGVILT